MLLVTYLIMEQVIFSYQQFVVPNIVQSTVDNSTWKSETLTAPNVLELFGTLNAHVSNTQVDTDYYLSLFALTNLVCSCFKLSWGDQVSLTRTKHQACNFETLKILAVPIWDLVFSNVITPNNFFL